MSLSQVPAQGQLSEHEVPRKRHCVPGHTDSPLPCPGRRAPLGPQQASPFDFRSSLRCPLAFNISSPLAHRKLEVTGLLYLKGSIEQPVSVTMIKRPLLTLKIFPPIFHLDMGEKNRITFPDYSHSPHQSSSQRLHRSLAGGSKRSRSAALGPQWSVLLCRAPGALDVRVNFQGESPTGHSAGWEIRTASGDFGMKTQNYHVIHGVTRRLAHGPNVVSQFRQETVPVQPRASKLQP